MVKPMNKREMMKLTPEQLGELVGQYAGTEEFQRGMAKGLAACKKKIRAERMKRAQVRAFEGK